MTGTRIMGGGSRKKSLRGRWKQQVPQGFSDGHRGDLRFDSEGCGRMLQGLQAEEMKFTFPKEIFWLRRDGRGGKDGSRGPFRKALLGCREEVGLPRWCQW